MNTPLPNPTISDIATPSDSMSQERTWTIRLPRLRIPSLQAAVLILLIVVGIVQSFQLSNLRQAVRNTTSATAPVSSSATTPAPAASGSSTNLPNMVGGC